MSSFTNTTNFDNLLLQNLMGRLQIRPSNNNHPFLTQSLEDLLLDAANMSDSDSEDSNKTQLAKEASKLEKDIIWIILSGKTDPLKPNSGQAITINEHHICITFREEKGSDYRGKPLVARVKEEKEEEEEIVGCLGLRELIDGGADSGGGRILHRNIMPVLQGSELAAGSCELYAGSYGMI
ncbi:hypothetical protein CRYUN_Cryun16bG0125200 [Craigia yunnanensis]